MRSKFDEQLENLNLLLIEMSQHVEMAIEKSVKALTTGNKDLVVEVRNHEDEINLKEKEIENMCLKLLLRQQPVARDLRTISSALKMITDLERIGDQANDIAGIAKNCDYLQYQGKFEIIEKMCDETVKMVNKCIEAYVNKDSELAKEVAKSDDIVDDCFKEVRTKLIKFIENGNSNSELVIDLLMISKYLERIGDHAVNVSDWVQFSITGEHKYN